MKKKYLGILLSALVMGLSNTSFAEEMNHEHHHHEMSGSEVSKSSIYQLDSEWKDQNNKTVKLKDFSGKPVVMTMLYTACTKSCPIIIGYLKGFYNTLSKEEKNKVNFVIVSFDSTRDTPKTLKAFEKKNTLAKNFFLLNGNDDNILEIASLLGIRFVKTEDDEYSHTNKILMLNKKGEIIHQNEGLTESYAESKKQLKKLF